MDEREFEQELRRLLTRAIADPGAITPRGDNYDEPLVEWQVRAVLTALGVEMAGWACFDSRHDGVRSQGHASGGNGVVCFKPERHQEFKHEPVYYLNEAALTASDEAIEGEGQ